MKAGTQGAGLRGGTQWSYWIPISPADHYRDPTSRESTKVRTTMLSLFKSGPKALATFTYAGSEPYASESTRPIGMLP